jgi:CubicO group peptidase (beta-lactamase class C family)
MALDTSLSSASRYFENYYTEHAPPGCGWAFVQSGELLLEKFRGVVTCVETQPIDRERIFRIASMTKSFAAAAALKLRAAGVLDFGARAGDLLNDVALSASLKKLSVREILTMSGQLPTDDPSADRFLGFSDEAYAKILEIEPLHVHDGALRHNYSNLAFILLGKIVSRVSGRSALDYILSEIILPAGLKYTQWSPVEIERVVPGHHRVDSVWRPLETIQSSGDGDTFAGLWSNLEDIGRWIGFLGSEVDDDTQVLSRSDRIEMCAPHYRLPKTDLSDPITKESLPQYGFYGYGLRSYVLDGEIYYGHSGGLPGYSSHMRWHSESGLGVVAFSNATYSPVWTPCALALHYLIKERRNRVVTIPPMIESAASALKRLIATPSARGFQDVFSQNVHLDKSEAEIAADFELLQKTLGVAPEQVSLVMSAGLQATVRLRGSGAECEIVFSLSPYDGGKIQEYRFEVKSA